MNNDLDSLAAEYDRAAALVRDMITRSERKILLLGRAGKRAEAAEENRRRLELFTVMRELRQTAAEIRAHSRDDGKKIYVPLGRSLYSVSLETSA